jgi:NADH-quinone oxidoreductase subunit L
MLFSEAAAAPGGLFSLVPLVVLFPLLGFLINIIFGGKLSEKAIGTVASTATGLAFVVAVLQIIALAGHHNEAVTITVAEWIHIGALEIDWAFRVDTLSVTMMTFVSFTATLIHIYAIGYMHEDVRINGDPGRFRRFFVYLNLFIVAMMTLVAGDNYLMLFVGWEGVGLCSFLLIGFWYEKGKDGIGNALAAKKAFVTNRVGDFGFLLAGFLMFWTFGSVQFDKVFGQVTEVAAIDPNIIFWITILMLLGVAGKSAQFPLYVWLPDAMAGPTPVSALIHAATMVTAGVYLVTRSAPLYNAAPEAQWWVATVGGVTALFAATMAVGQWDIKKVLAYSTISQLGFMVAAVGSGAYVAGIFHMVTHAFFKALLFLGAGSVILGVEHGLHHVEHDPRLKKTLKGGHHHFDPQDIRNMGGIWNTMRTTSVVYIIGALALAGIFPLAGFWSKDEILLETLHKYPHVFWMLLIAAFFTAFYMTRQVWMVFFDKPKTTPAEHAHDNSPVITVPLIILAIMSVIAGALNLPYLHTFGHWLDYTLEAASHTAAAVEGAAEAVVETAHKSGLFGLPLLGGLDLVIAIGSTLLALGAIAFGYYLYARKTRQYDALPAVRRPVDPLVPLIGPLFNVFNNKYWVDELYKAVILDRYVDLTRFLADVVDWRFWHDWFHDTVIAGGFNLITRLTAVNIDLGGIDRIANGLAELTQYLAGQARRIQTGYIRNYALSVMLGVVFILGYLILR